MAVHSHELWLHSFSLLAQAKHTNNISTAKLEDHFMQLTETHKSLRMFKCLGAKGCTNALSRDEFI